MSHEGKDMFSQLYASARQFHNLLLGGKIFELIAAEIAFTAIVIEHILLSTSPLTSLALQQFLFLFLITWTAPKAIGLVNLAKHFLSTCFGILIIALPTYFL
jgi:hypothetical protein